MNLCSRSWHADVKKPLELAMAPSQEEKSHTKGTQEIPKSVNRWNLCLLTFTRAEVDGCVCWQPTREDVRT